MPAGALSLVWRQAASLRNTLGCPTELERTTWSVEEHFQYGYMYWREDISWIYVLYDDHTWQDFRDTFREGQTESVGYVPPSGLLEPVRGFGKVWREQLGGPQARIGWATDKERGVYSQVLAFERGEMLHVEGRVYVLYRDSGTWEQFAP